MQGYINGRDIVGGDNRLSVSFDDNVMVGDVAWGDIIGRYYGDAIPAGETLWGR